jgi:hypothetical protein
MAERQSTCGFTGCVRSAVHAGYCNGHYQQKSLGMEMTPRLRYRTADEAHAQDIARFKKRYELEPATGCWEWQGVLTFGYGYFWTTRQNFRAHRFSYELHKGEIPEGLTIDHLCRNRACVNPDHLEAVPQIVNTYRAPTPATINAGKMFCPSGHRYTQENTRIEKAGKHGRTRRKCRICDRDRHRKTRAKRTMSEEP